MKKLKETVLFQKLIDENMMLFDPTTGNFMTVNEVGGIIVKCLKENYNIEKIIDKICDIYEVDRYTAEIDVAKFIEEMDERELLDE